MHKGFVDHHAQVAVALVEAEGAGDGGGADDVGRRFQLAAGAGAVLAEADGGLVFRVFEDVVLAVAAVVADPFQFAQSLLFVAVQQQVEQAVAYRFCLG